MTGFRSVAATRGIDQIVEQIRAAIQDGRLADNARLPSERELASRFEVSRGVIREAVKILNGMGLVESRQGAGIYVTSNPAPLITRALTLALKPEPQLVNHLFDIRIALETLAVRTAVRDAPSEVLRGLESLVPETDDGGEVPVDQANHDDAAFHSAIAAAAGNPYLEMLSDAVRGLLAEAFPATENQRRGIRLSRRAHREIARAMVERDAERAVDILLEHVSGTRQSVSLRAETKRGSPGGG